MIVHEDRYLDFIASQGVGDNDVVASSQASYVSYLKSVSELLGVDISPSLLSSEADVVDVAERLKGARADKTIGNYCSAMRQYVAMVQAERL